VPRARRATAARGPQDPDLTRRSPGQSPQSRPGLLAVPLVGGPERSPPPTGRYPVLPHAKRVEDRPFHPQLADVLIRHRRWRNRGS
jgi:hypothetical protein